MINNTTPKITIHSMKLASFLMMQGFILKRIIQSKTSPNLKVFIFRYSDLMQKYIEYFNENKKEIIKQINL